MDKQIRKGNLNIEIPKSPELKGWFMGHFIDRSNVFHNQEVEVKWGIHKKGEVYSKPRASGHAKSLSILIKGKVEVTYPDHNQKIILSKFSDYAFWESGVFHHSKMLEDSIVLTIRWPSVPNDKLVKK